MPRFIFKPVYLQESIIFKHTHEKFIGKCKGAYSIVPTIQGTKRLYCATNFRGYLCDQSKSTFTRTGRIETGNKLFKTCFESQIISDFVLLKKVGGLRIELPGISNVTIPNLNPWKIQLCNSLSSFVRPQNLPFSYTWLQILAFLSQLL